MLFEKCGGMTKVFKVEFLRNEWFLISFIGIHGGGRSSSKVFCFFYSKFSCYPSAKKIIVENLLLNRVKSDAFYTM